MNYDMSVRRPIIHRDKKYDNLYAACANKLGFLPDQSSLIQSVRFLAHITLSSTTHMLELYLLLSPL
jgi:hypothetical protein